MLNHQIKNYKKNGFCVVRNFINKKKVNELNYKINKFFEKKSKKLQGKDINFVNTKINSIHDIDKFDYYFKKFSKQKHLNKIIRKFLNSQAEFRKAEIFAKPAKYGLPSPFHQDNYYWAVKNHNALTVWVALDKSNKLNGGVTYLKGSHKYGLVKHINSFAPGSSQKIDTKIIKKYKSLKKVTPSLEPGDALIHHCLTFHGSSRNKTKKNRLGFTMQFKDKTSSYDMDQLRRYQRRLKKQILIRKKNKI